MPFKDVTERRKDFVVGIVDFFLSVQLRKRPYTTPQGRPERRKELTKRQLLTPLKDVPERRKATFKAGMELEKNWIGTVGDLSSSIPALKGALHHSRTPPSGVRSWNHSSSLHHSGRP